MSLGVSQVPATLFGKLLAPEQLLNVMVNFVTSASTKDSRASASWWNVVQGAAQRGLCSLPGGQCLLAVDFPRPPSAEEQQRPLLPAAVEASAPDPPEPGPGQGLVVSSSGVGTWGRRALKEAAAASCYR